MTQTVRYGGVLAYTQLTLGEPARPYAVVRIHSGGKYFDTIGLLDTGADNTLFHQQLAPTLGLTLVPGQEVMTGGVGGQTPTWFFNLSLTVNGKHFPARVGFSPGCPQSFGLLGRSATFRAFRFGFEELSQRVLYHST